MTVLFPQLPTRSTIMTARNRAGLASRPLLVVALLLLGTIAPAALAAVEPVGRVISASGEVTAVRIGESARSLGRGDPVYEGDEIRTGERGNTQIRFDDGGLFDLDPDTRFQVDRYRVEDDGGGSALLSFLTGALRTITGSIGGTSADTYRLSTPTATIGIRGTDYVLRYCDAACAQEHGGEPGLYGRVDDGAVRVNTPRGSADYRAGQFFFVPQGGTPRVILKPPQGILDGSGEDSGGSGAGGEGDDVQVIPLDDDSGADGDQVATGISEPVFNSGDQFEPVDDGQDTDTSEPELQVTGISGAGVVAAGTDLFTPYFDAQMYEEGGSFQTNADNQVISATFDDALNLSGKSVVIDDARLAESDVVSDLGVGWGRWEGSFSVDQVAGNTGHLAFTVTENFTKPAALASLSGTLNYDLAGGPRAFDTNGDLWTVDALSFNVTFGGQQALGLNRFELSSGNFAVAFGSGDESNAMLDTANNRFRMEMTSQSGGGKLSGKFVGVDADGAVVVFFVNSLSAEDQIVGTKVLRKRKR